MLQDQTEESLAQNAPERGEERVRVRTIACAGDMDGICTAVVMGGGAERGEVGRLASLSSASQYSGVGNSIVVRRWGVGVYKAPEHPFYIHITQVYSITDLYAMRYMTRLI